MRLLLDTRIFLWYIADDVRLRIDWRTSIQQPENEVLPHTRRRSCSSRSWHLHAS
jgi:hypothetical protein